MNELKNCPFCGGKAREILKVNESYIICSSCKAKTHNLGCPENRRYWNMRIENKLELKSCPFCSYEYPEINCNIKSISCPYCGCRRGGSKGYRTTNDAIKAWNTRGKEEHP